MKRILACMFVVVLAFTMICGCSTFGKWTPAAQTKLDTFGIWADQWVGGALQNAPLIIAAVSAFTGQTPEVKAALDAVTAAKATLGTYHAVVATGSGDPATMQQALIDAINQVKVTIGAVQDTIKDTQPVPTK